MRGNPRGACGRVGYHSKIPICRKACDMRPKTFQSAMGVGILNESGQRSLTQRREGAKSNKRNMQKFTVQRGIAALKQFLSAFAPLRETVFLALASLVAENVAAAEKLEFNRDIRPILSETCF